MKATIFCTLFLLISGLANFSNAQGPIDQMIKEWQRAKIYTREYLDAMPDSGYSFKPTAEMRSFAEQMLHLTDANYGIASAATGEMQPVKDLEKSTMDKSKQNVTKIVMAGYDFVINSLQKLPANRLKETIKLFNQFEMSRETALAKAFEHQTHHRGQTTVYLRLAGVKPPQEKLF